MAGPLLMKRKAKKLKKKVGKPPRDYKLEDLLNALQNKLKCQKNLRLYFGDNSPVKLGYGAKISKIVDDDDPLENCRRLDEKFATLEINKRDDNAGRCEKFHDRADKLFSDGEYLLKNSLPYRFIETFSTIKVSKDSQNVNEKESDEFFKACQRSAKKIAVPKIFEDSRSKEELLTKPNSVIDFESNPSKKIISTDSIDEVPVIVPKTLWESRANPAEKKLEELATVHSMELPIVPLEGYQEKINIVTKQLDEKTEKCEIVYKLKEKTSENVQIVSKPAEKREEKPDIVPNPLVKKTESVKIVYNPTKNEVQKYTICPKKQDEGKSQIGAQGIKDFRFSSAEKKKVGQYNSNIFNPAGKLDDTEKTIDLSKLSKRNIILDGSNVAFAHGKTCFSSEGLQYCLQYFKKMGHAVKAVVPLFRRNAFQSTDYKILDMLHKERYIVFTPCKNFHGQKYVSYDDRFILQLAYEWNAAVVSNDNYRDLIDECPAFNKIVETRVLGYTWFDDIFILAKDPYGRQGPTLDEILHI